MEIRQLRYLVCVAETGNFSEASKSLSVTQSAISQQIKSLEDELGIKLFIRSTHNVALSEYGEAFLPIAKQTLADIDLCYSRIRDLKGDLSGELNIGATYPVSPYVKIVYREFVAKYPKVMVNFQVGSIDSLLNQLRNKKIDIVIGADHFSKDVDIDFIPSLRYNLAAVMRKDNSLASRDILSIKDLDEQGVIFPTISNRERDHIERWLHSFNTPLRIRGTLSEMTSILELVRTNDMVAILSDCSTKGYDDLVAVPIAHSEYNILSGAYFLRDRLKKRSAEVFWDMLMENSRKDGFSI